MNVIAVPASIDLVMLAKVFDKSSGVTDKNETVAALLTELIVPKQQTEYAEFW